MSVEGQTQHATWITSSCVNKVVAMSALLEEWRGESRKERRIGPIMGVSLVMIVVVGRGRYKFWFMDSRATERQHRELGRCFSPR